MESIYWVLSWACHRRCVHCYDDRFRPYVRAELEAVVAEGAAAVDRIAAHLPADFRYRDPRDDGPDGPGPLRRGRVILAGGEVLLEPVWARVFRPALAALNARYAATPALAPRISIQTTGDLLTPEHLSAMLGDGVWMIAISGMDDFHVGMEGPKRATLMAEIRAMMAAAGVEEVSLGGRGRDYTLEDGPFFLFFGAQPKSWIGEIWPRGRAWANGLSSADMTVNFCARQSGALHFLDHGLAGSEVAVEPDGSVYPCCLKTKAPIGNLTEEPLIDMLEALRGHPALEALNRGDPAAMGLAAGWSREAFAEAAHTTDPTGRAYANLCIGCDKFFEAHLATALAELRQERLARRGRSVDLSRPGS